MMYFLSKEFLGLLCIECSKGNPGRLERPVKSEGDIKTNKQINPQTNMVTLSGGEAIETRSGKSLYVNMHNFEDF